MLPHPPSPPSPQQRQQVYLAQAQPANGPLPLLFPGPPPPPKDRTVRVTVPRGWLADTFCNVFPVTPSSFSTAPVSPTRPTRPTQLDLTFLIEAGLAIHLQDPDKFPLPTTWNYAGVKMRDSWIFDTVTVSLSTPLWETLKGVLESTYPRLIDGRGFKHSRFAMGWLAALAIAWAQGTLWANGEGNTAEGDEITGVGTGATGATGMTGMTGMSGVEYPTDLKFQPHLQLTSLSRSKVQPLHERVVGYWEARSQDALLEGIQVFTLMEEGQAVPILVPRYTDIWTMYHMGALGHAERVWASDEDEDAVQEATFTPVPPLHHVPPHVPPEERLAVLLDVVQQEQARFFEAAAESAAAEGTKGAKNPLTDPDIPTSALTGKEGQFNQHTLHKFRYLRVSREESLQQRNLGIPARHYKEAMMLLAVVDKGVGEDSQEHLRRLRRGLAELVYPD